MKQLGIKRALSLLGRRGRMLPRLRKRTPQPETIGSGPDDQDSFMASPHLVRRAEQPKAPFTSKLDATTRRSQGISVKFLQDVPLLRSLQVGTLLYPARSNVSDSQLSCSALLFLPVLVAGVRLRSCASLPALRGWRYMSRGRSLRLMKNR